MARRWRPTRPLFPVSCGKVRYPDRASAGRAALDARAEGLTEVALRDYHCAACHGWHLTRALAIPDPPVEVQQARGRRVRR